MQQKWLNLQSLRGLSELAVQLHPCKIRQELQGIGSNLSWMLQKVLASGQWNSSLGKRMSTWNLNSGSLHHLSSMSQIPSLICIR